MSERPVNYDEVASTYDDRYRPGMGEGLHSIPIALRKLLRNSEPSRILEAGCGTGFWLDSFPSEHAVYGLDLSLGMLGRAKRRCPNVTCGDACCLPFADRTFDLIYCVNALHHFHDQPGFIREARRLLRTDGKFATIGMDPHRRGDRWYVYDYFEGTYETDLRRYPPASRIEAWMSNAGFREIQSSVVVHIVNDQSGRDVFSHYVLQKTGTSQLILINDDAYAAGLNRMTEDLAAAEANGDTLVFPVDISLVMVTGSIPD